MTTNLFFKALTVFTDTGAWSKRTPKTSDLIFRRNATVKEARDISERLEMLHFLSDNLKKDVGN